MRGVECRGCIHECICEKTGYHVLHGCIYYENRGGVVKEPEVLPFDLSGWEDGKGKQEADIETEEHFSEYDIGEWME